MVMDRQVWAKAHFGKAQLGDKRRTQRLVRLAKQFAAVPGGTITGVFPDWAEIKAAYRLLDGDAVTHTSVCAGSFEQVQSTCRAPGVYLMIEDTTAASFPTREAAVGLGPVGEDYTRGFWLHSTLAVRWQCHPEDPYADQSQLIGLAGQSVWVRDIKKSRRKEKKEDRLRRKDRESARWGQTLVASGGPGVGGAQWIYVADRESDIYEVFARCGQGGSNFVVRSAHDRALTKMDQQYLHDALAVAAPLGRRTIDLPAGKGRAARCAILEIRATRVQLRPPYRPGKALANQDLNVVEVREVEAPADADPVHWVLLTDLPIATLPELWKVVAIYRRRWLIEEFHKALKSGVGLEQSQLTEARKLMALAGILSIVACFLVGLKLHARANDAPPLDETQVDHETRVVLEKKVGKPKEGWTYQTILVAIAKLGGYIGRRSDGPPGWQTIWRGWQRLLLLVEGFRLAADG
jgi:hypothetical protein